MTRKSVVIVYSRLAGWIMPQGTVAFTLGRRIFARPGARLTEHILAEELCHCRQYAQYGFFGFTWRYFWWTLRYGYRNNPFEVEAREFPHRLE